MIDNVNYTFPVSLSMEKFMSKEESGAVIGTSKDDSNRKIREQYGYTRGVSFIRVELNANTLLDQLLEGRVFCHLFNPKKTRIDGTWGMSEKTNENFAGSYVIGVDIDKTGYNSIDDYISTLTLPPTFYYTTYSNQQFDPVKLECKGLRFRMIYVFDERIENPLQFRFLGTLLNNKIEDDTREPIEDDCGIRCSQYFNGTCKYNSSVVLKYGITNTIYSFEDLGYSTEEFNEYLKSGCNYKTRNRKREKEIESLLNGIVIDDPEVENNEPICSPTLVEDMKRMDYNEFMRFNRWKYKYSYRSDSGEWIDDSYQLVGDDYFSLYWNVSKVKDGSKRRKKLFERICLRRVMNPGIDPDTLLFNAYEDRYRFFEIDKDLDIDCLVRNVEMAMDMSIEDIETMYSSNLAYLRSTSGKSGIILKPGTYESQSDVKDIRWHLLDQYYDPGKTLKENLKEIQTIMKIEKSTLYSYCKEKGIETDSAKISDEQVIGLLDLEISANENYKKIREMGYKIDRNRLLRIYREMKR